MNKKFGLLSHIKNNSKLQPINTSLWGRFKIEDLFDVECSKYHDPNNYVDGDIPYIARTTFNNGEIKRVKTTEELYPANCITIGAESARAFYQENPFITGNKTYRIYANTSKKSKMTKNIGLFIATLLNKEGEKYNYTNAFIQEKIKNTTILLPVKNDAPDWDYMEKYIKQIYNYTEQIIT